MESAMIVLSGLIKMAKLFLGTSMVVIIFALLLQVTLYNVFKFNLFKKVMEFLF